MSIKTRLAALEARPIAIPDLPPLSDEQLQAIIGGTMETGTLTAAQIDNVVRGRDLRLLSDAELTYIISG